MNNVLIKVSTNYAHLLVLFYMLQRKRIVTEASEKVHCSFISQGTTCFSSPLIISYL